MPALFRVVAEAAFGVISACYTNIAISVSFQRDQGILKRTRGTPLPGRAYMSARVIHAMVIAFVLVAITVTFGVIFYSASVPTGVPLLQFLLTLLVGGLSFAALALALVLAEAIRSAFEVGCVGSDDLSAREETLSHVMRPLLRGLQRLAGCDSSDVLPNLVLDTDVSDFSSQLALARAAGA